MEANSSFMVATACVASERSRVLVIAKDPWARDTLRVLLGSMGCQCLLAESVEQALATTRQENPGAAIVDLAGKTSTDAPALSGLDELCLTLRGRVIVLTDETPDAEATGLMNRYGLPRISRERLVQELWGAIDSLLWPNSLFRRVLRAARLVFDSFLEPAPVGIRGSQPSGRRFVYEFGNLMIDLWLGAPLSGSRRVSLVGQLLDTANPERQFETLFVVLRNAKGPVARGSTNKSGEFQFEFDYEPEVELDIETAPNEVVTLSLPRLDYLEKRIEGTALSPQQKLFLTLANS